MGNNSFMNRRPSRKKRHGFTLVELMVVITIIGIVALIAIPNFASMQRRARIRSATQQIAQHFKMIRERALSSSGTYQFSFPDQYHYRLHRPDGSMKDFRLGGSTGGKVHFGGVGVAGQPPEASMAAPGAGGIDFPGGILIIDARGGATSGVAYVTDGRDNYAIGINRLGKIAIYEYSGGAWNP